MQPAFVNSQFVNNDMAAWHEYRRNPTPQNRSNLLQRFSGLINGQVNKWTGSAVSRDVLLNEARLLAVKAFDNYKPESGASLATYLTNQLLPLSRVVYTHQNIARMPENLTQKVHTFSVANDMLKTTLGREPTTEELHNELGWTASEISRVRDYNHSDLIESGPKVTSDFYGNTNVFDDDEVLLGGIYFELTPDEKQLFEHVTGYNGVRKLSNPELMKKFKCTQSQLSYRKTQLRKHIDTLLKTKLKGF